MKPHRSMLFLAATIIFCVTVISSAQAQKTRSSSVTLGDKVIVIPDPEGFEEASSQFELAKQALAGIETGGADNLLHHMTTRDCERMRTGSRPEMSYYTKVSVDKGRRESIATNEDLARLVAEIRKNGAVLLDPDGPMMKSLMVKLSRQISEAKSQQIAYEINDSRYLGEFDVRAEVYSGMVFFLITKDVKGTKSTRATVGSMTLLKVRSRIINIGVYRNLSSPEAVENELKPTIVEVKQFTTKWVNEILAANRDKQ